MILRVWRIPAVLLLTLSAAHAQTASPRNANYTIEVALDVPSRTLKGRETLAWTNITAAATSELQFHLYYNAWRDRRSSWMRELHATSWWPQAGDAREGDFASVDISLIRVSGSGVPPMDLTKSTRFIAPDDGNADDRTVMVVPLPQAVGPGQRLAIEIAWTSRVPRPFARTGVTGSYFFLGQWFPKIGVLEADGTWNCHQFHVATEFFSDYGDYDVRITVPRGWPVAATGRERERNDNPDGTTSHRYYQEDVHDFAWTTSPDFVEHRDRFEHPGLPLVDMRLMLQPEHGSQAAHHFAVARAALRRYGEWFGPYPYGHLTIVDPVWDSPTGGMEYPTLFTAGTSWLQPGGDYYLDDTIVHEVGHQWWYGIVGSNEMEDAWMDEGINQYANARAMAEDFAGTKVVPRFFGDFVPWVIEGARWDRILRGDLIDDYRRSPRAELPSTPSFRYRPASINAMTYAKPALWLHTLERALGWTTVQRILATFLDRWRFRHPRPGDFFQVANEVSGRDLTPFFDQVYRSPAVFDYAVESVSSDRKDDGSYTSDIVVRRQGDGIFPMTILVSLANGEQRRFAWDGAAPWHRVSIEHPQRAVAAQIDPEQVLLLDTNFTNNSYTVEPESGRAATKWAVAWMVWLQDQLLTWAFFI